jgi:hypothetical protein
MRRLILVILLVSATAVSAADPLTEARRLYTAKQYEAAERLAREAAATPALADAAFVVLGRIKLERYRQTANAADLASARDSFRRIDPRALDTRERVELAVGLGEAVYLDDRFGAAAELFEGVLDRSVQLGPGAHDRVLDWWATALDRQAQRRKAEERAPTYARILARMRAEVAQNPGSTPANYWLVAAARACGDLEQAWTAAAAGWLRAPMAEDRGAALRADLDRLVVQAIIPERAGKLSVRDSKQVQAHMLNEWKTFKENWTK